MRAGRRWLARGRPTARAVELVLTPPLRGWSDAAGRYQFGVSGTHVTFTLVADDVRAAPHDSRSQHVAAGGRAGVGPGAPHRATAATPCRRCRRLRTARGSWPSFRGPQASGIADGQQLPDTWDVKTGENILWRTPIPGLAHSSPIVWGDRVFVTTAISQRPNATFKPGLYGDGDASDGSLAAALDDLRDRQAHREDALGARRARGRAAQQAPHQVHLRERHAGHRRPHRRRVVRIARRVCLRRERQRSAGRSISAASTWARTTSRRTSGDRPARRSSGTAW